MAAKATTITVRRYHPYRDDEVVVQYVRTEHYSDVYGDTAYDVLVGGERVGTVLRHTSQRSWPLGKGSRLRAIGKYHHTWGYRPRTNRYARGYDTRLLATEGLLKEWLDGDIKGGKATKGQVNYG